MKRLILLRHAKAEHGLAVSDHDRPLTPRGERDARQIGAALLGHGITPDAILSSTAVRALETAKAVARALSFPEGDIMQSPSWYSATADELFDAIATLDDACSCAILVGHNPEMTSAASILSRGSAREMPPGTAVVMEVQIDRWIDITRPGKGTVTAVYTPKKHG